MHLHNSNHDKKTNNCHMKLKSHILQFSSTDINVRNSLITDANNDLLNFKTILSGTIYDSRKEQSPLATIMQMGSKFN